MVICLLGVAVRCWLLKSYSVATFHLENKDTEAKEKTSKGVDMFAEDADMFSENYNVSPGLVIQVPGRV